MGFDLGFLLLTVIFAIQGLFKGFAMPVLRLSGLVLCVFLAEPLWQLSYEPLQEYFTSISPDIFKKIVWWGCVFLAYFLYVGVLGTILRYLGEQISRRFDLNPLNQALGLGLGVAKGLVVSILLATLFQAYRTGIERLPNMTDQFDRSRAIEFVRDNQPVSTVWNNELVREFRAHIHKRGWFTIAPDPESETAPDEDSPATASNSPP